MPLTWSDFGTNVGIDVAVSFGVFFGFNYLRSQKLLSDFYGAKRKLSLPFRFRPPRLPPTLFTWMEPVFKIDDEKFAACAGFDALLYVRTIRMFLRMTIYIALIVSIIVLPVNWTATDVSKILREQANDPAFAACADAEVSGEPEDSIAEIENGTTTCPADSVSSFDKTSLTNINNGDEAIRLWAHVVALYLVTYVVLSMLWAHYAETVKWRVMYLAWTRKGDAAHTVLLTDIPGTPSGTIVGRLNDNLDGFIGRLLPKFVSDKIKLAMNKGISAVFENKVTDKIKLNQKRQRFQDVSYDVYTRNAPHGGRDAFYEASRPNSLFGSASSGRFYDAESQNGGSFFSSVGGFNSAGNSPRSFSGVDATNTAAGASAVATAGERVHSVQRETLPAGHSVPPASIAGRRNLANFESRPPPTDFETWKQAETGLQEGLTVKQIVACEFQRSFGADSVDAVNVVKNELRLGKLVSKYEKTRGKLEDMSDSWTQNLRRKKKTARKQIKVNTKGDSSAEEKWGPGKVKVDEMEYNIWLLDDMMDKIKAEQQRVQSEETSAAFVTMKSRKDQSTCAGGIMSHNESFWQTSPAPDPSEIIWNNVQWRAWERTVRSILGWGVFATLILCFLPIVTLLQQLIALDVYAEQENGAWARFLLDLPLIGGVIQGILPTLGLKIFLALVPIALKMTERFIVGSLSFSAIDFAVGRKYFLFQFVIVFVFTTIIGAASTPSTETGSDDAEAVDSDSDFPIVDLIETLADDPGSIATFLGRSIPQQASYYIMYILANGLLAKGVAFLRLPGAAIYFALSRLAGTKRQKKKVWSQQYMDYGTDVPDHTITILLVLVFSISQPFVALVAVMYFAVVFFYSRYDLLYTKRERYQTGGLFWPEMFNQVYLALMVALVGYFALFAIKGFPEGGPLVIVLFILAVVWRKSVASTFDRPMTMLSFHAAGDLDRADLMYDWMRDTTPEEEAEMKEAAWDLEAVKLGPIRERYRQTSLVNDVKRHEATLEEARSITERVRAFNAGERKYENEPFMMDEDCSDDGSDHTQLDGQHHTQISGPVLAVGEPVPARAFRV